MDTVPTAPNTRPTEAPSAHGGIDRNRSDWYKDAVIYQLHVKCYADSDGDGVGDFAGLIDRLDYVASLGVNAIWLMPFYPSPLKDDGYDIADYLAINKSYGSMRDFRRFIAEAHRRGIRVITELVINHTSDQHRWFQKARKAKPGSAARDFYVWSDTPDRYQGTRIIFLDTEKSNWTWDDEAQAFFWHRFYSHQPDLNFDNPRVMEEVKRVMKFWLDAGVDGLRLDAIPYLVEREGTNNENLPETHVVLKDIRKALDAAYSDRMLLAEANQWPEDTQYYFGEGDECHMAFHFPLMPRMYMALAQEDRLPVTDIIRQTPDIPPNCQWAIFLRNHDELTLEMVTPEERDYLWRTYAGEARARINLGIRRRLAPLLDNDRRKIELMNALLLSMPGTPVIYYGDELGMGDNYFLGDRDGVRTPMQWSGDRNGGFSRANPQQLYLPPIMDPIYGYQSVNVEAQQKQASSLLNWMRRLIAVRTQHNAFGRGTFSFLYPRNRRILAFIREHEGSRILCIANLSRSAQAAELDLSAYKGAVPIELTGASTFPPVGELPYMLTLPAYGFYWFLLAAEADAPRWHAPAPEPLPEFVTLTARGGQIARALEGREKLQLERDVLPQFLTRQRWYAGKAGKPGPMRATPLGAIAGEPNQLVMVEETAAAGTTRYLLPLSVLWGEEHLKSGAPKLSYTLAKIRSGARPGALIDASFDERFQRDLLTAMQKGASVPVSGGTLHFETSEALRAVDVSGEVRNIGGEQSNVSIGFGGSAMLKIYRQLRAGEHPEIEIGRFLTGTAGFRNTPAFLGSVDFHPDGGEPTTLASCFAFVFNQGDAWYAVGEALLRDLEHVGILPRDANGSPIDPPPFAFPLDIAALLGRRTAELHAAFAAPTDNAAFAAEPLRAADIKASMRATEGELKSALAALGKAPAGLSEAAQADIAALLDRKKKILGRLKALGSTPPGGVKTRIHGDFHLGQVLVAQDDVVFIDFEGEPERDIAERRSKASPLRDVAGMLRSFDYLTFAAIDRMQARDGAVDPEVRARAIAWRDQSTAKFLAAYWPIAVEAQIVPDNEAARQGLLDLFLIQKASYEILYEIANRPGWVSIPVRGLTALAGDAA